MHDYEERLQTIESEALNGAGLSQIDNLTQLDDWYKHATGPASLLTQFLKGMGAIPAEHRKDAGSKANALKQAIMARYESVKPAIVERELEKKFAAEAIDVTLPGREPAPGVVHPISQMIDELSEVFALMGFQTVFGREVEAGRYNFDLLNIPSDHPARDVWDTMIVETKEKEIVLRTHTSPMQARVMEQAAPPIRVIVPGRCYRYEAQDASHEWMFQQLEGLAVDTNITMSDLKGVLQEMARQLFGPERRIRFRCDFFPFVEPGVDFAVDCAICNGKGCRVCKHTGWLEMGGAGMVHPKVLAGVGYDPEVYQGFAFGLGIERLVMMKYGVNDIRGFASNDLRFLGQFARASI
jgi:phenylalanyl-tRNA synthetase alpha chain